MCNPETSPHLRRHWHPRDKEDKRAWPMVKNLKEHTHTQHSQGKQTREHNLPLRFWTILARRLFSASANVEVQ